MSNQTKEIVDRLENEISSDVGNMQEDEIELLSNSFDQTLAKALRDFNSDFFDNDGFIKKMKDMDVKNSKDKEIIKHILGSIRTDYSDVQGMNQSELMLRRDLFNICTQMPEMRDVVYIIRDSIIECNVSTGEVSRSLVFTNMGSEESNETKTNELEERHDLLMAIKNFIIPRTLMVGEMYIHIIPYAKLFAELEAIRETKEGKSTGKKNHPSSFRESIPQDIINGFKKTSSLYSDSNLKVLMESMSPVTKIDYSDDHKINNDKTDSPTKPENISKDYITALLKNIDVCNGSSILREEMGDEGFTKFVLKNYSESHPTKGKKENSFMESIGGKSENIFNAIKEEDIDFTNYSHIKGCYIKYLDPLRMIPIRMDRRIIGYYYISITSDLQNHPTQPNGIVDLSLQHYTKDRNLVDQLASMIIKNFDKSMIDKNIQLKSEIAEIVMAHKFSDGRLSFVYIPENEIVRTVINEDENGKGHSILEPSIFPARMYLMLTLYNMIYTLNNNTTRIHYLRSSGLNKNYASQIQTTMRKYQSRRITADDIYSFNGAMGKVGGAGELILPSGRGDYKAIETDTLEAVPNPFSIEFLEQQRRQALSGTGVPQLMVINAIDEVDFAKTLEMANTRFLSTVSGYKIDFNRGITKLYQILMRYSTDIDDEVIQSFKFQFNAIKQQELTINADMIANFNTLVEVIGSLYYTIDELQDENGKPTHVMINLRKELAREYLPQLNFEELDKIMDRVNIDSVGDKLQDKASETSIGDEDLKDLEE